MKREQYNKYRWYGFDVDGTIADNSRHSWIIDTPIKPMVRLMKKLHRHGCDVRILSGRLGDYASDQEIPTEVQNHIWRWCDKHLGFRPKLTGRKDSMMEFLYDDRAKQVICNTGVQIEEVAKKLAVMLDQVLANPRDEGVALRAKRLCKESRRLGLI